MQPRIILPEDTTQLCIGEPQSIQTIGGAGEVMWQIKSAPGDVEFGSVTAPSTTITSDTPGIVTFCAVWTEEFEDTGMCAFEPRLLQGNCPRGAPSYVEWRVVPPFTVAPIIFSPNQIDTYVFATEPGVYQFELKCYYYGDAGANPGTNVQAPVLPVYPAALDNLNQYDNQFITCPLAVLAGQTVNFALYGCESSTVAWEISAPGQATVNTSGSTTASYGTQLLTTGDVTASVQCTDPVTGAVTTLTCVVPIIPFVLDTATTCDTNSEYVEQFDNCGFACTTTTESLTFVDCDAFQCSEAYVTVRAGELCG